MNQSQELAVPRRFKADVEAFRGMPEVLSVVEEALYADKLGKDSRFDFIVGERQSFGMVLDSLKKISSLGRECLINAIRAVEDYGIVQKQIALYLLAFTAIETGDREDINNLAKIAAKYSYEQDMDTLETAALYTFLYRNNPRIRKEEIEYYLAHGIRKPKVASC